MEVLFYRNYWKYLVSPEQWGASVFFLDQDWGLWIDPLMIQVDRAFALERATAEREPVVVDDNRENFYRLEWLSKVAGFPEEKRLQIRLHKITLKYPGRLVRAFDYTTGGLG